MSYTPFNAPLLAGLLGDRQVAGSFSVEAEIHAMLRFEIALAEAEADRAVIPAEAAHAIEIALRSFDPDIASLSAATARDGVVVPELVRQMRAVIGEPHGRHVHFGATSQDAIDTSLILRLKDVNAVLLRRMAELEAAFSTLIDRFGANALMARTRMQAAIPITAGDRIANWSSPLHDHRVRFEELAPRLYRLQFGGAAGTLDRLGDKAGAVSAGLAARLHLSAPARPWHTDRSALADYGHWLALVTGALGKFGQDVALMAQNGIDDIALSGGGASSAMPHKQNPVLAESLVTLARFNATLVSGMHHALVHEQERSGAAWTLEWMLLPQMAVATGAALRNALALCGSIERIGDWRANN